jgi:SsrA-binding protein
MNNHIPRRERKLLLHRHELRKLKKQVESGGKTIVPLRLYFKESLVKIEISICVGKKLFDKRDDLKKKAVMRDDDRSFKFRR